MESPRVLVTDGKIERMNELVHLLEALIERKESLLIIADDVIGEALSSLVLNKMRGVLDVCAIKSPGFGDRQRGYLEDIAVLTGGLGSSSFRTELQGSLSCAAPLAGTLITEQLGLTLQSSTLGMLGRAARVSVSQTPSHAHARRMLLSTACVIMQVSNERTTMIATGRHTEEVGERIKEPPPPRNF